MCRRPVFPRSSESLDVKAAGILRAHFGAAKVASSLPIPIERIVEVDYGLRILWDVIDEEPGEKILGALRPQDRTVMLNETHLEGLFERYIGPYEFTLAHELGHWLMDTENPDQMQMFSPGKEAQLLCRNLGEPANTRDDDLRESNANRFAARLLLPADMVRAEVPEGLRSWEEVKGRAEAWRVSQTTLQIRLQELGLPAPE